MKAAILEKINLPLVIRNVETTSLKTGQVLVKILMSGLCGSQVHEITGEKGNEKFLPHMMGHEGCGIVEQIGSGVTTVQIGDKVVMHWRIGTGIESEFPQYILDNKIITSGKVTTLSEYSICSENRLTRVPIDTDERLCCLLGCSLTTAFGVIDNETNIKIGESVMIIGAGSVGLNLIQAAKMKGAYPIYVLEKSKNKQKMCIKYGCNTYIDTNESKEYPKNIDIIIDTTANTSLISDTLSCLSFNGRYILVGQGGKDLNLNINMMQLFSGNGKIIKASQGGQTNPDKDIDKYIKLYNNNMINIDDMITHTFTLNEINVAFDMLRSGTSGKILIKIC
jgi:S-(hydroxymethyl)glutathione dehydrogenase / alcohol dehydrogenase